MTTNPKLTITYEDLGGGIVRTSLAIHSPSRLHPREARIEQASRAWKAVLREYGVKYEADAFEIVPSEAVRH